MAVRRGITARITGQLVSIADGREFEFVGGDVLCGSQTGLGGEGATASSWVSFEIAREQGESDVDGSEVALTMRISWRVSSDLSFLYYGAGTFFSVVCSPVAVVSGRSDKWIATDRSMRTRRE